MPKEPPMLQKTVERPAWTRVKRAICVWSEDDATVGHRDHERLAAAFERIYKVPVPAPLEVFDDGDAVYKRLPASLMVCASYPGNSSIHAWPILHEGDPITVVLKWPSSIRNGERLVHTSVYCHSYSGAGDGFQASDDDRPTHLVTDHTVTWVQGHVDFNGREALALLQAAQLADEETATIPEK